MRIVFDLWGTLIKSNPLFTEGKKVLYKKYFSKYNPKDCELALNMTKKDLNELISRTGIQPSRDNMMGLFYKWLTGKVDFSEDNRKLFANFYEDYQKLATIFPPLWYSEDTQKYFEEIYYVYDVIIISNTLFISGQTLQESFNRDLEILSEPTIMTSSNAGVSKPHPSIYYKVSSTKANLIIGDSVELDGGLANSLGCNFFQINSNDKTIKDAHEYISTIKN